MNIVITGSSSGIGLDLLTNLRDLGHNVIGISRSEKDSENSYTCDVSDYEKVIDVFRQINKKYGNIDVLINNAGYGVSGAIELIKKEDCDKIMDVNFNGVLYCSKAALPYMKKGSKIINISSACALFALPYRGLYCASKSAVTMLSYSLRMEVQRFGVEVCSVCPGDVKTNFTKNRVKVFDTNERYGTSIENSTKYIDSKEDKRMPVSVVTKKLIRLINRTKLPALQIIGAKYKLFYFFSKILPINTFLKIENKIFNKD